MEHRPTDPLDDDETLLGDADELDDPSLEEQLDDQLDSELADDEDV